MKITVKINDRLCIGSGSCVMIDEERFSLDEQGKAIVTGKNKQKGKIITLTVTSQQQKKLLEAAHACPTQAITLIDEDGNTLYPSE